MTEESTKNPQLTGIAGVYYVAAELSKRGFVALMTIRNTAEIDLLALDPSTNESVGVQVKTLSPTSTDSFWLIGKKGYDLLKARDSVNREKRKNLIYVFVKLSKEDKRPKFWIAAAENLEPKMDKSKTGSLWYYITRKDNQLENWGIFKSKTK